MDLSLDVDKLFNKKNSPYLGTNGLLWIVGTQITTNKGYEEFK